MPRAFDGTVVPARLPQMSCGGTPEFDEPSGYAYRCDTCFAVIGSIGQSDRCKEENKHDHLTQSNSR
jgi:hypothetical protein